MLKTPWGRASSQAHAEHIVAGATPVREIVTYCRRGGPGWLRQAEWQHGAGEKYGAVLTNRGEIAPHLLLRFFGWA